MRNENPYQHQQNWSRQRQSQRLDPSQQHTQHHYYNHQNMQYPQLIHRQLSMEEALNIAREQVQGQVVKIELESKGGRLVYEIDIINPQGVKYEVIIDINTGTVLEVELD